MLLLIELKVIQSKSRRIRVERTAAKKEGKKEAKVRAPRRATESKHLCVCVQGALERLRWRDGENDLAL